MDAFYHAAEGVVSTSQRNLNGGVFTFILDQLKNSHQFVYDFHSSQFFTHFLNIINSGGYLAGIFLGVLWCMGLLFGFAYIWCLRCRNKIPLNAQSPSGVCKTSEIESPRKFRVFLRCRKLQSNWLCIAFQCVTFIVMVGLLFLLCILGFVASYSLHSFLIAKPQPLSSTANPTFTESVRGLIPGITSALQNTRIYMSEFPTEARIATKSAVDNLIQATVEMQNKIAYEFNALLLNMLGIDRAFDLGDKLGSHTVNLLNFVTPLKRHLIKYTDTVSSLSMAIARWNGYMEQLHAEKNLTTMKSCEVNSVCELPILAQAEVSVSSNWRLPQFDFAIALNFVTDVQNRTPEVIEEQLKSARLLAERQLERTMERMRAEIDIPGCLRNLTEQNWNSIAENLNSSIMFIDNLTDVIPKKLHPVAVIVSKYIFAIFCLIWLAMFAIALGISMLLYHFHCVPASIKSRTRRRIRSATSFVFIILVFCVIVSCMLFLMAGYAHTEVCRYISSERAVTEASFSGTRGLFVLDTYVNTFLDQNWNRIVELANRIGEVNGRAKIPLPKIRSPMHALSVACKQNAGILDAFGAIESFDFSLLNRPEMTNEFVAKARVIMRDTLMELDTSEMFPPALTESVQLASRLDDFLIPFDKVRQELPRNFINVTTQDTAMLMSGTELASLWQENYSFLKRTNLTTETLARADELASIVFNLSSEINSLLESVDESLLKLAKIQRIGSTVSELQGIFDNLMNQLRNRDDLTSKAMELYDSHVAKVMPKKAEELVHKYGPPLLREVGRCRKLHDAYSTGVSAVCDLIVGPLNGLWFFSGFCVLLTTLLISLGLPLLLHKIPSFPHAVMNANNEGLYINTCEPDGAKSGQTLSSLNGVRVVQSREIHGLIRGRGISPPSAPSHV